MGAWTRVEQDPNKARLDSLSKRLGEIKKSQEAETARQRSERGSSKGVATGMRIVTELLAAILGSLLIGWFLDRMLGTSPLFLLRSEEHTSELPSLLRISYAVFCLKKKTKVAHTTSNN